MQKLGIYSIHDFMEYKDIVSFVETNKDLKGSRKEILKSLQDLGTLKTFPYQEWHELCENACVTAIMPHKIMSQINLHGKPNNKRTVIRQLPLNILIYDPVTIFLDSYLKDIENSSQKNFCEFCSETKSPVFLTPLYNINHIEIPSTKKKEFYIANEYYLVDLVYLCYNCRKNVLDFFSLATSTTATLTLNHTLNLLLACKEHGHTVEEVEGIKLPRTINDAPPWSQPILIDKILKNTINYYQTLFTTLNYPNFGQYWPHIDNRKFAYLHKKIYKNHNSLLVTLNTEDEHD